MDFCVTREVGTMHLFNTFRDFCNYKFVRKYLEFGTKKLEKTWNLGPKTLRKPGIWYLEKSGNPAILILRIK